MGPSGLILADKPVEKEAFEAAIKGNTVEGRKINWETTYQMYFDPSGKYFRLDSLNNRENGNWSVDKNGDLVMEGRKKPQYRTVKQRDDGGYDIYGNRGEVIWTIDKILPGDPHGLAK
ncbi:MAG: hypothetical protein AMJ69_08675 [Gammaproteobacteria bacterium SG8_47]|nr:MAG: hypothetical protein AMJ69_08675 [Gammaproteobacteria bacterium SG8_47]